MESFLLCYFWVGGYLSGLTSDFFKHPVAAFVAAMFVTFFWPLLLIAAVAKRS